MSITTTFKVFMNHALRLSETFQNVNHCPPTPSIRTRKNRRGSNEEEYYNCGRANYGKDGERGRRCVVSF